MGEINMQTQEMPKVEAENKQEQVIHEKRRKRRAHAEMMEKKNINLEEMRQEDNRKVKGVFKCFQPVGGSVSFYFKKYRGDNITRYDLEDGKTYELPLMVANHLNENCYEEDHKFLLDQWGNPIRGKGKRRHRFTFQPQSFSNSFV